MTDRRISLVSLLVLALLIAGCQTAGVRDDAGALGVQTDESPADIYVQLGLAYMREGRYDIAMRKLKHGLELDPRHAQANNVLGVLYERLGEHEQAADYYQKALRLAPKNPYIRNAWGSFLCKRGRYSEADEQFNLALQNPLYETPWIALTNAGICARKVPDLAKAERYLRKALTLNKTFPSALYQMALISHKQGKGLSARAYLERYLAVAEHTPASLLLGVRIERSLGNRDAEASYELLLRKKFPDAPEVLELDQPADS